MCTSLPSRSAIIQHIRNVLQMDFISLCVHVYFWYICLLSFFLRFVSEKKYFIFITRDNSRMSELQRKHTVFLFYFADFIVCWLHEMHVLYDSTLLNRADNLTARFILPFYNANWLRSGIFIYKTLHLNCACKRFFFITKAINGILKIAFKTAVCLFPIHFYS